MALESVLGTSELRGCGYVLLQPIHQLSIHCGFLQGNLQLHTLGWEFFLQVRGINSDIPRRSVFKLFYCSTAPHLRPVA